MKPESERIFIHRSVSDAAFITLDHGKRLGVPMSAIHSLSPYALGLLLKLQTVTQPEALELLRVESEKRPAAYEGARVELARSGYVYSHDFGNDKIGFLVNTTPMDPDVAESRFAIMAREMGGEKR